MRFSVKGFSWFAFVFLVFWAFGMTTGLASSACRNGLSTPLKTARACAISLTGLKLIRVVENQKPSDGLLYLSAVIARWQNGNTKGAEKYLVLAYDRGRLSRHDITLVSGHRVPEGLFDVMARIEQPDVPAPLSEMWWNVVQERDPAFIHEVGG
ncbi:hypothetical protein SAMN04487859_1227 [Roseovarius lutimaris]|uniref:Uncharacterized protein n=1 Tax=Roseovarius lutimaris TaxID=1005928 RepID=A0A1I5FTS6_9RHOB|nr:hypothetical protein [Roseovarius lutimaris]SFO27160.1 hypothetical protein SAMN04487859_1227 [Roseovarius lutimaris]